MTCPGKRRGQKCAALTTVSSYTHNLETAKQWNLPSCRRSNQSPEMVSLLLEAAAKLEVINLHR
jgi:hypothetical protein